MSRVNSEKTTAGAAVASLGVATRIELTICFCETGPVNSRACRQGLAISSDSTRLRPLGDRPARKRVETAAS